MNDTCWKENSDKDGIRVYTCMTDKCSCLKVHTTMKDTSVDKIWEMGKFRI